VGRARRVAFVTRRCEEPRAGSSDKDPDRLRSAVSMFRKCLKTMAPQLGLEPDPEIALVATIAPISLDFSQ
jgi:hypothetical protein